MSKSNPPPQGLINVPLRAARYPAISLDTRVKFLDWEGRGPVSYKPWRLPADGAPGAWMPTLRGALEECERGYHTCTIAQARPYAAETCYLAEVAGEGAEDEGKAWHRRARLLLRLETWNDQTLRLWACDCAERVLPLTDGNEACARSIFTARRFAFGLATPAHLAAAWNAAWGAAWDTARDTAWNTAWNAAWGAAWAAAGAAARAAAWGAAGAAAGAAARATETAWQTERLLAYLRGEVDLDAYRVAVEAQR